MAKKQQESKPTSKKKQLTVADVNDDPSLVETLSVDNAKELLDSSGLAGDLTQRITSHIRSLTQDTTDGN